MWLGDGAWHDFYWGAQLSAYPATAGGSRSEFIHDDSAVFCFFDGHVERLSDADVPYDHKNTFWWPYGINMENSYIVVNHYFK